jgi:hypothetical protein
MELFNPRISLKFFGPIEIAYFIVRFLRVGDLDQPNILEPLSVCSQLSSDRPTSQLYGAATPASKSLPLPETPRRRASAPRSRRVNTGLYHLCRGWRSCGGPAVVAHGGGSLNADAAHIGRSGLNFLSNLTDDNTLKS